MLNILEHLLYSCADSIIYTEYQGSHKLWKSWKTWKITKKNSMHGKIMEFEKNMNNHVKIMEFCEII